MPPSDETDGGCLHACCMYAYLSYILRACIGSFCKGSQAQTKDQEIQTDVVTTMSEDEVLALCANFTRLGAAQHTS